MQNCYKGLHFFLLLQSENTQPQTVDKYRSCPTSIDPITVLLSILSIFGWIRPPLLSHSRYFLATTLSEISVTCWRHSYLPKFFLTSC